MPTSERGEGFYVDAQGSKQDADLHFPILDGGDDRRLRMKSFRRAVELGVAPDLAARVYQIEGGFDLGPLESLK